MFWDLEPNAGVDSSKLQTLIGQNPTDWENILTDSELFSTIRAKEDYLVKFFEKEENISNLIDFIFSTKNEKAKKSGIGLFHTQESPLLNTLSQSQKLCENLITRLLQADYLDMGYISRIFQQSLSYLKENTQKIFQNSKIILKTIITKMNESSIFELLDTYIFSLKVEDMWPLWSLFKLIVPPITIPKVFNDKQKEISDLHSEITHIDYTMKHRINIMILVSKFVTQNQDLEISPILHPILPKLLKATQNEDFIAVVLELCITQKPSQHVANFALDYAKKPLPMSKVGVLSLQYIAKYPSKQTLNSFPDLLNSFLQEKNNTFHLDAFLSLIKSGMKIGDFRKLIIEKMVPILLKECVYENWRKNAQTIGYLLNIALLLDKHIGDDNSEWMKLRANELSKWSHKEDGAIDIGSIQTSMNTKLGDDLIFTETNSQVNQTSPQEQNNQTKTENKLQGKEETNEKLPNPPSKEGTSLQTTETPKSSSVQEKTNENKQTTPPKESEEKQNTKPTPTNEKHEQAEKLSSKQHDQEDDLVDSAQLKRRSIPDDVENDYTPVSQEQPKPVVYTFNFQKKNEKQDENLDISFSHFKKLLNDECWETQQPVQIAKLFDTEDKLSSPEAAYLTIIQKD